MRTAHRGPLAVGARRRRRRHGRRRVRRRGRADLRRPVEPAAARRRDRRWTRHAREPQDQEELPRDEPAILPDDRRQVYKTCGGGESEPLPWLHSEKHLLLRQRRRGPYNRLQKGALTVFGRHGAGLSLTGANFEKASLATEGDGAPTSMKRPWPAPTSSTALADGLRRLPPARRPRSRRRALPRPVCFPFDMSNAKNTTASGRRRNAYVGVAGANCGGSDINFKTTI